jgi:hypothetical protein
MRRIAILLAALAVVVAACGDDDGSVLGAETTAPTATSASEGGTTAGGAETTMEGEESPTTMGEAGSAGGSVQAALDAYQNATFRAVYRFGAGADEQIITLVQDPSQDPPVSATLIGQDGEEGRFLTIGDQSLMCGPPGEDCIEFPGDTGMNMGQALFGPMLTSLLTLENVESTPGFTVEQNPTTVAGRTGVCFTFSPTALAVGADIEFIRQCIDSELGFILLFEGLETGGDAVETIMELLEFGLPQPGDFEPTGPVTTMPGG